MTHPRKDWGQQRLFQTGPPFPPSVSWVTGLFWGQNPRLGTPFSQITSSFPSVLLILQFTWSSWAPSCAQNLNWFSENSDWLMISSDGPRNSVIFWGWINLVDNYGFSDPQSGREMPASLYCSHATNLCRWNGPKFSQAASKIKRTQNIGALLYFLTVITLSASKHNLRELTVKGCISLGV